MMKFLLSLLMFSLSFIVCAENTYPPNCKPVKQSDTATILSSKKMALFLIHNLSKHELWLSHPSSEGGASAGWSTRLQADKWSAFFLEKNDFELNCIESKPGHEQNLPCNSVISVCKWSNVAGSDKEKGSFWAGENMMLPELLNHLEGRGFRAPKT